MLGLLTTKIFPFPTIVKTLGPSPFYKPIIVQNIIKMQFFQLFHLSLDTMLVSLVCRPLMSPIFLVLPLFTLIQVLMSF
ncbi:hypothetical protein SAMN04487891_102396 [Flagellimonas taeanensis]|uniref:Uncharacterized protein n=1 Tax=Flagellimonas taeanensis TaxID=1005926 RepID=A0A1M6SCN1_9FLAO|nr:hypothetical protein SAMN04487891_102396 [Allomuricauda taeanensis]SHK42297.1 hypothetical protein SAMN05216293_1075 [Allomuricauda taeanensis]